MASKPSGVDGERLQEISNELSAVLGDIGPKLIASTANWLFASGRDFDTLIVPDLVLRIRALTRTVEDECLGEGYESFGLYGVPTALFTMMTFLLLAWIAAVDTNFRAGPGDAVQGGPPEWLRAIWSRIDVET